MPKSTQQEAEPFCGPANRILFGYPTHQGVLATGVHKNTDLPVTRFLELS